MNTPLAAQKLLEQILPLPRMEHGSLSVIRRGPNGPSYNLNSWEEGTNHCRYIPQDKVPEVRQAIAGYQQCQKLARKYGQTVAEQTRAQLGIGVNKKSRPQQKPPPPQVLLAHDEESQQLMTRCLTTDRSQIAVDELNFEARRRTAVFQSPRQLIGYVFQQVADRIDAAYQPKPGYQYQWRIELTRDCLFGSFQLQRNYYSHEGRHLGHYPTAAALGLEGGKPPALARLVGFKGADQDSYQKAEEQLKETGGIQVLARRIQRRVQPVGAGAQPWQERAALAPLSAARPVPILHVSADATGVPRRKEALAGRPGQQPDGRAKTRSAYLGCIFTQH